jgi:antitoxin component of MazEF toxin-antitoxin module
MHAGKLQTIGNSLGIILPRGQLREAGWSKGDYIAVEFNGKEFFLHRVRDVQIKFHDPRARPHVRRRFHFRLTTSTG